MTNKLTINVIIILCARIDLVKTYIHLPQDPPRIAYTNKWTTMLESIIIIIIWTISIIIIMKWIYFIFIDLVDPRCEDLVVSAYTTIQHSVLWSLWFLFLARPPLDFCFITFGFECAFVYIELIIARIGERKRNKNKIKNNIKTKFLRLGLLLALYLIAIFNISSSTLDYVCVILCSCVYFVDRRCRILKTSAWKKLTNSKPRQLSLYPILYISPKYIYNKKNSLRP